MVKGLWSCGEQVGLTPWPPLHQRWRGGKGDCSIRFEDTALVNLPVPVSALSTKSVLFVIQSRSQIHGVVKMSRGGSERRHNSYSGCSPSVRLFGGRPVEPAPHPIRPQPSPRPLPGATPSFSTQ